MIWLSVDLINHPDLAIKRATIQCLHTMTTHGEEFWRPLLGTGLIDGILLTLSFILI